MRMEQLVQQINQNEKIPYSLELYIESAPDNGTNVMLRAIANSQKQYDNNI
jgi:hypothetical protein